MLACTARALNVVWHRSLRNSSPRQRWAATDPALDIDPREFPAQIVDRSDAGRRLFASLVGLAVAGDETAAMTVMVALLPRMVASESRHPSYEHDALVSTLWEAIVTSTRLDQPWLRESIERRAWKAMWRERQHRSCFPVAAVDDIVGDDDVAGAAVSSTAITRVLDELTRQQRLTDDGRRLLVDIAAGAAHPIDRRRPGGQAEKKRRERTIRRIRSSPVALEALAS